MRRRGTASTRRSAWFLCAWGVLIAGIALSAIAAEQWRTSLDAQRRRDFDEIAVDIAARLETTLRRDMDLTASAAALLSTNPELTDRQFDSWSRRVGADDRHPESLGFQFIANVPSAGVTGFATAAREHPLDGAPPFNADAILPLGTRDRYCLVRAIYMQGAARMIEQSAPQILGQLDWCATPIGLALAETADSGRHIATSAPDMVRDTAESIATSLGVDLGSDLEQWLDALSDSVLLFAPVYRADANHATVAERRSALLGWVGAAFDIGDVVDSAVNGRRGLGVALHRADAAADEIQVTSTTGGQGDFERTAVLDADGEWTATVVGTVAVGELASQTQAALVLAFGSLLSAVVAAMIGVLAGSRRRALDLVEAKTRELRHQALHDELTGLPNRALILGRCEHMIDASKRSGREISLMFVDLDDFKQVNDTLGHAAGDELLRQVANCLRSVVRPDDTVGRMGGDEFVVLCDADSLRDGPAAVAGRLQLALRQGFLLPDDAEPIGVTASIGIAVGDATMTPDDLLRDADVALYEAKAAGKGCHVVYGARGSELAQVGQGTS